MVQRAFLLPLCCTFEVFTRCRLAPHSARTFFDLGLNLGRMLSMSSGVAVVRATAQLLAEFEYYVSEDGSLQDWVRVCDCFWVMKLRVFWLL
jgi:hypothetical protein